VARDWLNDPPATLSNEKVPPAPMRGKITSKLFPMHGREFLLFRYKTMSLSKKDVQKISSRSIRGYDKFHRMFMGIASELERYAENIMYLRIENTENTWPSNYQTAVKFAHMWKNWNEELTHAEGFVVSFYKTETTGFTIEGKDAINKQGLVYERIKELIAEKRCKQKLVSIFSGVFSITTDEITPEDGEGIIITCGAWPDADEEEQSFAQHQKQHLIPPN
jgi:hypothetical protein